MSNNECSGGQAAAAAEVVTMGIRTDLSAVLFVLWVNANMDANTVVLSELDLENWDPAIRTPFDITVGRFIFNPVARDDLGNNVQLPVEKAWLVITSRGNSRFTMSIDVVYAGNRTMTLEVNTLPLASYFLAQLPDNLAWEYRLPPSERIDHGRRAANDLDRCQGR